MKRREPMLKNDGYGTASTSSAYRNPDAPDRERDQQTPRNRVPAPVTVPVERPYYRSLEWYMDSARVDLGMEPLNPAFFADHSTSQQPSHHSQQVRGGGHAYRSRSPPRRSRSRSHEPLAATGDTGAGGWDMERGERRGGGRDYQKDGECRRQNNVRDAQDERTVRREYERGEAHGRERNDGWRTRERGGERREEEPTSTCRGRVRGREYGRREREEEGRDNARRRLDRERRFEGGEFKDYREVKYEEPMETCRDDRGRGYAREREARERDRGRGYGWDGEQLREQGELRGHREERPMQTRRIDERRRDGRDTDGVRDSVSNNGGSVQGYGRRDDEWERGSSDDEPDYGRERSGRERYDEGPINNQRDSRDDEMERDTREPDSTMESVVRERDDEWRSESEDGMEEYDGGQMQRDDRFEFGYDVDVDLAQPMEIRTTPRDTVSMPMEYEERREHREEEESDTDEETDTESEPDPWSDPVFAAEHAQESYYFENGTVGTQNGWSSPENGWSGRDEIQSGLNTDKDCVKNPKSQVSAIGRSGPEKGASGPQNGWRGGDEGKSGSGLDKDKRDGKDLLLRDKTGDTKMTKSSLGEKSAQVVEEEEDDNDVIVLEPSPEEIARRNKAKEEWLSVTWKDNKGLPAEDREMAQAAPLSLKECVKVVRETTEKQKELKKLEFTAGCGFPVVHYNDEVAIRKAIRDANKREGGDIAAKVAEMSRAFSFGNEQAFYFMGFQAYRSFKWSMQHNLDSDKYTHLKLAGYAGERKQGKKKCLFKPNVHKAGAQRMLIEKDWGGRKGLHVFSDLADVSADKKETVPPQVEYLKRNQASLEFGMPDLHIRSKEDCWKCDHKGPCVNNPKCGCWRNSNPPLSEDGRVYLKYYFASQVIVCGPLCGCEGKCKNTLKLEGTGAKMEIFRNHQVIGYELRTLEPIATGQFVIAFVGDLVFHDMFLRIPPEEEKKHACYALNLFYSDEHRDEGSFMNRRYKKKNVGRCPLFTVPPWVESGRSLDIDPSLRGNEARFIRHSCHPNLFGVRVFLNTRNPQQATFALFASEPLVPGEILSFDYGERFVKETFGNCCHCGTRKCPVKVAAGNYMFKVEKVASHYRRYLKHKIEIIEKYKGESVDGEETADEEVFEEVKDLSDPLPRQEVDVSPEGVVVDDVHQEDANVEDKAEADEEDSEDEDESGEDSEDESGEDSEDESGEDSEDGKGFENPDGEEDAEAVEWQDSEEEEEDEVEVITIDDSD